jgi:hypothetical protein
MYIKPSNGDTIFQWHRTSTRVPRLLDLRKYLNAWVSAELLCHRCWVRLPLQTSGTRGKKSFLMMRGITVTERPYFDLV